MKPVPIPSFMCIDTMVIELCEFNDNKEKEKEKEEKEEEEEEEEEKKLELKARSEFPNVWVGTTVPCDTSVACDFTFRHVKHAQGVSSLMIRKIHCIHHKYMKVHKQGFIEMGLRINAQAKQLRRLISSRSKLPIL